MTIQKLINNGFGVYKSSETSVKPSWGVERVIFNSIVENTSATGKNEFRLNNRDPRFLFKNGVSVWVTGTDQFLGQNNVTINNAQSVFLNSAPQAVALNTVLGSLEIDFFGTDINLLIADGMIGGNDFMLINPFVTPLGGTEVAATATNLPFGSTSGTGPNQTISDRETKSNQVLPLGLALTEGFYKVRLEFIINDASSTNIPNGQLPLFGCELINARTSLSGNTNITDGEIFDSGYRYDLSSETGLPLLPTSYSGNTRGARVVNYIHPLDKTYEQGIQIIPSTSTVTYRAEISAAATWAIPDSVTEFTVVAHGSGGTGGTASFRRQSVNGRQSLGAGSGGGGGAFLSTTYAKTAGSGGTLAFTLGAGGSGTSTVITGGGTGLSGSVTLPAGISGIGVDRDTAPANTENLVVGSGGNAGTAPANATITGLTDSNTTLTSGIVGGDASYQTSTGTFSGTARGTTAGAGGDSGPSSGGVAGNNGVLTSNNSPSDAGSGQIPGAGGGGGAIFFDGGGDAAANFHTSSAGSGATGRVTIEFIGPSGLGNQGAGFQEVVDHSNEEVVRKVNWRDFGILGSSLDAGFASTILTGLAQYAFTLDDGTTTLAGNQISIQTEQGVPYPSVGGRTTAANQSALRFTFVGTGLDILAAASERAAGNFPYDVIVDGVNIGEMANPGTGFINRVIPIISGLAYGTHVVTFQVQTGGTDFTHFGPTDFIIYGPKKPDSIPSAAIEIADYNIMADYVLKPNSTGEGNFSDNTLISQGTLGKTFSRELRYNGGWSDFTSSNIGNPKIFNTFTGTFGAYMEYTFYGTGFELMARTNSANFSATISIDGSLYTGAATPILPGNSTLAQISTWTPGTSTWTQVNSSFRDGISISGLSLGLHTIRLTFTAGSQIHLQDISTITPIHYQNHSLTVGNTSIGDIRPDTPSIPGEAGRGNLGEAKAWASWDEANKSISSSYNTTAIVKTTTAGIYTLFFDKSFKSRNYVLVGASDNGLCNIASGSRSEQHPGSITLQLRRVDTGALAEVGFDVAFFGELIDE